MTHQGIRIRTDIFQSQEFALLEERADGLPLNLILPTPVPTIINDFFKPIDEPEGLRLGNGKDCWAAFDERRKKELRQARNLRRKNKSQKTKKKKQNPKNKSQKTKKKKQNPNNLILGVDKGIDLVNGSYSCSVCQIELEKGQIHKHLKGLQHATYAAIKEKNEKQSKLAKKPKTQSKKAKMVNECKQIDEPEVICSGNSKDYNDNRSSEDLPYPAVNDIQGQVIGDEQSLEEVKKNKELVGQINRFLKSENQVSIENWQSELQSKGIDFVNGRFSCSVCEIGLGIGNVGSHLQGKRHAMAVNPVFERQKQYAKLEKKLNQYKQKQGIEFIVIKELKDGNFHLICSLCEWGITDAKCLKNHLNGEKHKLNLAK